MDQDRELSEKKENTKEEMTTLQKLMDGHPTFHPNRRQIFIPNTEVNWYIKLNIHVPSK
jgi:hypothetical protein